MGMFFIVPIRQTGKKNKLRGGAVMIFCENTRGSFRQVKDNLESLYQTKHK